MNTHSVIRTVMIVLLAAPSAISEAGVIVDYNMDALTGSPTSVTAASSATGVTPLLMSVGDGLTPISVVGPPNYFGANGWDTDQPDDYMEFGFSVQPGYVASLTQISLSILTRPSGPKEIGLYLMTGGSGSPVQLSTISLASDTITAWSTNVSLSGISSSVRLRLMEVEPMAPSLPTGSGSLRLFNTSGTNIQVLGNVSFASVPEPAHGAVVVVGILAYLRRRHRNQRSSTALGPKENLAI